MYCLDEKHETEYSGLEYDINNCIKSDSEEDLISWIPFGSEDEEEHAQKIE